MSSDWKRSPALLIATLSAGERTCRLALDPGPGARLRWLALLMTILVPVAGAALVVLAGLYLRSLLAPYDRMLATAGAAPGSGRAVGDEREFLIGRFESTVAALSEKEKELQRLARLEKERADDLETAARTLARNLPTGLLSIDPAGTIVELNEAGREILALDRDAHGKSFDGILAETPELREIVARVLSDRRTVERREARWMRDGVERVLGVTATAAMGADGRFLGVLALFTDLSEVRRLESRVALARHLADLGEVSAGAAHEFRNASAAIDGYADLALRHPERAGDHLKAIRREAQEMSRVTSDFLLFARPEGFVPEGVAVDAVVGVAAREIEAAFPGVTVARSGDMPEVRGSAALLRRALSNLLRNAVQATDPARRGDPDAIVVEGLLTGGELALADRRSRAGCRLGRAREDLHAVLLHQARRRGLRPRDRRTDRGPPRRDGRGGSATRRRFLLHRAAAGGGPAGAAGRGSFGRLAISDLIESLSKARSRASAGSTMPPRSSSESD